MTPIVIALLLWTSPTTDARRDEVVEIGQAVEAAAEMSGEDPWMLAALVVRESSVRVDVVGKLGERGPAQVIPHYVGMSAEEVATADGGMLAAVRALEYWRRRRPQEDRWQCFAAGRRCAAARSKRVLLRRRAELLGLYSGYYAARRLHP